MTRAGDCRANQERVPEETSQFSYSRHLCGSYTMASMRSLYCRQSPQLPVRYPSTLILLSITFCLETPKTGQKEVPFFSDSSPSSSLAQLPQSIAA